MRGSAFLPEYEAWGRERWSPSRQVPRHRHRAPYAALVLWGGYEEAGDGGRRRVGPGDVLLHDGFEAHLDRMEARGAETLNLPLPPGWSLSVRGGRIDDADAVVRVAEHDPTEAACRLLARLIPAEADAEDWPDDLARALAGGAVIRLGAWAGARRLAPATVSRGFFAAYGATPSRYRLEARARSAWRALQDGCASLAAVAQEAGFADQAHMTRAVTALTGRTPSAWRRGSIAFKTASERFA